ncbi:hypothetical protein ACFPRL_30090 [Pseudoclavibacter helvolus]
MAGRRRPPPRPPTHLRRPRPLVRGTQHHPSDPPRPPRGLTKDTP